MVCKKYVSFFVSLLFVDTLHTSSSVRFKEKVQDRERADRLIQHLREVIHELDVTLKWGSVSALRKALLEQKGHDENSPSNYYFAAVQKGEHDHELREELEGFRASHRQVVLDCGEHGYEKAMLFYCYRLFDEK